VNLSGSKRVLAVCHRSAADDEHKHIVIVLIAAWLLGGVDEQLIAP
jgi:hypothetical protein